MIMIFGFFSTAGFQLGKYISPTQFQIIPTRPIIPDIILNIVCEMPNPLNCGFVKDDDAPQYKKRFIKRNPG